MYNLYDLCYSQSTVYMNGECTYLCRNIAGNEGGRSADYFPLRFTFCSEIPARQNQLCDYNSQKSSVSSAITLSIFMRWVTARDEIVWQRQWGENVDVYDDQMWFAKLGQKTKNYQERKERKKERENNRP